QWGVDFRPEYLQIGEVREVHPEVPMIALTASATPDMISDIEDKLQLRTPSRHIQSFARANLSYNVNYSEDKQSKLVELCQFFQGTGIVYCKTRGRTQEMQRALDRAGIAAAHYHAGLNHVQREKTFQSWTSGKVRVMCATNAFGMGIDKSDVRFVIHMDMPMQPESYFQEVGRAGRDGKTAYGILLWNDHDTAEAKLSLMRQFPTREAIRVIYQQLMSYLQIAPGAGMLESYPFSIAEFAQRYGHSPMDVLAAMQLLKLSGYLRLDDGAYRPSKIHVLLNKNSLYNFQVMNPHWEDFVTLLLRMYGGLFEQYVPIREVEVAKLTGLTVDGVVDKLKKLQHMDVIEYIPHVDSPLLTLLTGRLHEDEIRIPKDFMESRMEREQRRLDAMIHLVQDPTCRSQQLLRYFGEDLAAPCGICDVCRGAKKSAETKQKQKQFEADLHAFFQSQVPTDEEIYDTFSHVDRHWLIEQIRALSDEGKINRDQDDRWHWHANA
ncbi:MAG: helicase-related protein, partial [Flavobacteriales bacterium]